MTIGYKYAVVLPKASGLPRDEVVNDFYTNTVLDPAAVTAAIGDFYSAIQAYFALSMAGGITVNQYAIPDTRPPPGVGFGPPLSVHTDSFLPGGANGLPAQVSCVVSFHADFTGIPEHGPSKTRPRASRRGRIYLGELATTTIISETTGPRECEFTDGFITDVSTAASALLHISSLGWSVFSHKNWALYPVVGGWVDDSPDTTRRRKVQSDSRHLWS